MHTTSRLFFTICVALIAQSSVGYTQTKPTVQIGSKSFTESVILGDMLMHLAQTAGANAEHQSELGGTQVLWQALLKGDIDMYVEYTGTIREELLSQVIKSGTPVHSEIDMRDELAKMHVIMSERIGFNNTYALGMREALAEELKVSKISDLRNHPELKLGLSDEFMERKDGWNQLKAKYRLPHERVRTMDHNLAYRGIVHDAIQVTDLYSTDAEIESYKLRVLEDDLGYFPTYFAMVLYREDLKQRAPEVVKSILRLENAIDSKTMSGLTSKVRLDRELETNVAANFLNDRFQCGATTESTTMLSEAIRIGSRLLKTTLEHLFLVVVSLSLAIVVAIPLGIYAAKSVRFGQYVLGIIGVIQTLPSMALLVFMIPLFGLGAVPAIAALFFYSLLPIVRNTFAGITQIPLATIESAQVLGLGSKARLKLIELPLAMPSILAGIKTAAVINVGTATIGALIGAGGYGAPILTGIRLYSIPLILQGAIPAAVLALVVQYGFGKLEKYFVSPGLLTRS